jgi:alpha(1,3/1,4) fucosyltransferase
MITNKILYFISNKDFNIDDIVRDNSNDYLKKIHNILEINSYELSFNNFKAKENINTIIVHQFYDFSELLKIFIYSYRYNIKIIFILFEPLSIIKQHNDIDLIKLADCTLLLNTSTKLLNTKYSYFIEPVYNTTWEKFNNKKFLHNISAYKTKKNDGLSFQERLDFINFLNVKNTELDLFGIGWDKGKYPNYKGKIDNKQEVMREYKYAICFENTPCQDGCITEKIFDCFQAGCVPIYYGPKDIKEFGIEDNMIINYRNFNSIDEVLTFMENINEEQYNDYLKNIKLFLKSDKFYKFTDDYFAKNILETIEDINNGKYKRDVTLKGLSKLILLGLKDAIKNLMRPAYRILKGE